MVSKIILDRLLRFSRVYPTNILELASQQQVVV